MVIITKSAIANPKLLGERNLKIWKKKDIVSLTIKHMPKSAQKAIIERILNPEKLLKGNLNSKEFELARLLQREFCMKNAKECDI